MSPHPAGADPGFEEGGFSREFLKDQAHFLVTTPTNLAPLRYKGQLLSVR
ncbi:hypothetical protein SPONL_1544 [uncultured Candidatus Thioglobus sp.]|nr:hypothetical protein SPONL_1544 [uncultured Candidatus Thioglobus sp.]